MNKEFANNKEEIVTTKQEIFDSFNDFIFSNDTKIMAKLIARVNLFNKTLDVPGDILECGVFKGSGIMSWLKIKKILSPNSFKKVVGFDMFNDTKLLNTLHYEDKEMMGKLFSNRNFSFTSIFKNDLKKTLEDSNFYENYDFELIEGDVCETSKQYVKERVGAKISILYMDLDLEKPTYEALNNFWERVSKGGMVVFDEYGYHQWSESVGVDKFVSEKNLTIKTLDFNAPTAYIIKE